MRIIYYTASCFLDFAIPMLEALSKIAKVHLIVNMQPATSQGTIVDLDSKRLKGNVYKGKDYFGESLPDQIYDSLENLEGFWVIFHPNKNFIHPRSWPMIWHETSFINSLKADILHLDSVSPSIARMIFRIKSSIVCTIHDPTPHSGEKSWRNSLWRKLTFPHVKHYVVHSHFSKNILKKSYKIEEEKISVIPLSIYSTYKFWHVGKLGKMDRQILFFGRLSQYKGIEILIQAMKLVAQKLSNVKLIIAGKPVPRYPQPEIPMLENNCEIKLICRFIPTSELSHLFEKSSICVLPYLDATQSGVVLTSFALNTPVVASFVGGIPEYVVDGETGILVPPKDPERLAEALICLLSNSDLRKEMVENIKNGRTGIPSWNQISEMLRQTYTTVLKDRFDDVEK